MYEFSSDLRNTRADKVLNVSESVEYAFSEDLEDFGDPEIYVRQIVDDMVGDHPAVFKLMGEVIRGWDLEQAAACDFAEGYALAYRLLNYQIEVSGPSGATGPEEPLLPSLDKEACESFLAKLRSSDEDGVEYRLRLQKTSEGRHLVPALIEAVSEKRTDEINFHAIILGGLTLCDFLYQQLKWDDVQHNTLERAQEKPAYEARAEIKTFITRTSPLSD